ncbi:MAG: creatininase family protein [Candidatus Omnitrophica bacterium]|nr:creatininase family protein [Candidatus Omnitrophota bacterium]
MKRKFEENTYEELKEAISKNVIILFPIGQIEEHGLHLPLKTDAFIAEKICEKISEISKIPVIIMPCIYYGYSTKEVKRWPGCSGVEIETFIKYVYDICFSLIEMGFKKIVIVSSHGNHTGALEVVVRKIADNCGVYIALTVPNIIAKEKINKILEMGWRGSCHGGEYETSLMLYLDQESVKMEKATDKDILKINKKFYPGKAFISTWGLQKSKTGIYGAPKYASKEKGKKLFDVIVEEYLEFLKEF